MSEPADGAPITVDHLMEAMRFLDDWEDRYRFIMDLGRKLPPMADHEKTDENFRLLLDPKGRFVLHRITPEEATYKLCRVKTLQLGEKGVPHVTTHDGRTIRYPDPEIRVNDSVLLDIASNKILDFIRFDAGQMAMVTGGRNAGRVGTIMHREKHKGSHDIVQIKDSQGHTFATRLGNVFLIGKGSKPLVSLPKGKGVKLSIVQEQAKRFGN